MLDNKRYVSIMHNRIKEFEIDVPHSNSIFFQK
jgi:hypothetical protein